MKRPLLIVVTLAVVVAVGISIWFVWSKNHTQSERLRVTADETIPNSEAQLETFSKPVYVLLPGETDRKEAFEGQKVPEGTTVITGAGGRAQILYPNHTVTRLDFNTEISVAKLTSNPAQIKVKLEKNRIWSRIPKLLGNESYQTESSTVVATVRGTSYGHGILPDGRNKVSTTKGTVVANCAQSNAGGDVKKDTKSFFDCGKETEVTSEPIDKTDQDEWYGFNEDQDKVLNGRFETGTYDDDVLGAEIDVLGVSTLASPTPQPAPVQSTVSYIDCVGPDGKTSHAPKADCDNLNKFWAEHQPQPNPSSSNSSSGSSSSTTTDSSPSPSPSSTPGPDTQGPIASNFQATPSSLDGLASPAPVCDVTVSFDLADPSGVQSVSVDWRSFDSSGLLYSSGNQLIANFVGGPAYQNLTGVSTLLSVSVPAFGKLEWDVNAYDTLNNNYITPSGTPVNETGGGGCYLLIG